MKLIDKTIDLMEYTYRETSRKDRFPIKYRTIIFEMQTNSLNIYKMLLTANKLPILWKWIRTTAATIKSGGIMR